MKQILGLAAVAWLGSTLLAVSMQARAGGGGDVARDAKPPADRGAASNIQSRRLWKLRDFTSVQLVAREPGSLPNQHPVHLSAEAVRHQLGLIRMPSRGTADALFTAAELEELAQPLVEAFSAAGPGDDVVLLSTARRGEVLSAPFGVTARLFAQADFLNLIVHDTRLDFVDAYIGARVLPRFEFGSRSKAAEASIQSTAATNVRRDWLSVPVAALATTTAASGTAAPAAVAVVPAVAAAASSSALAASAPSGTRARDAAFYDEQGQRLQGLKRLRDQGAITEAEYQQKRKEILSGL